MRVRAAAPPGAMREAGEGALRIVEGTWWRLERSRMCSFGTSPQRQQGSGVVPCWRCGLTAILTEPPALAVLAAQERFRLQGVADAHRLRLPLDALADPV